MKLAIIFLLPALVISGVARDKVTEIVIVQSDPDDPIPIEPGVCCEQAPCFIGCPVKGVFKVKVFFFFLLQRYQTETQSDRGRERKADDFLALPLM